MINYTNILLLCSLIGYNIVLYYICNVEPAKIIMDNIIGLTVGITFVTVMNLLL